MRKYKDMQSQPTRIAPRALLFAILLVLFAVAGCNRDRNDLQPIEGQAASAVIPATSEPVIASQNQTISKPESQPTSQPTSQPANTPILSSPQQLVEAQELYSYGNYASARTVFASILSSTDREDASNQLLRQQVQYELAQAYFAEDYYSKVLIVLEELLLEQAQSQSVATDLTPKIDFLQAKALTALGQNEGAIAAYQQFLAAYPWMAEAIYPQMGALYLKLNDIKQAEFAYRQAADATNDNAIRAGLLETLAQIHKNFEQYDKAVAVYDEILSFAQNAGYRASIYYLAGETLADAGDETGAIARWQMATDEAPSSGSAYQSLIELVNREVDFDLFQRGMIDLDAKAWWPTINAFQAYLDSAPATDERAGQALHGIGQAYLGLADYASALKTFSQVLEKFPNCDCMGQVWLDKAKTEAAFGDREEARRTYRTFARTYPQDPLAAEALWLSGLMAYEDGKELEAAVDFRVLADSSPLSERAPVALYITALGAYQKGLYPLAIESYDRLQDEHPLYRPGAASYWLGRSYQAEGDLKLAKEAWQRTVESNPGGYYGVLAAYSLHQTIKNPQGNLIQYGNNFVGEIAAVAGPSSTLSNDDGGQLFAEAWLADWLQSEGESLSILPSAVAEDVELNIGRMLLELDQRREALQMLGRVYQRYKDEPRTLYALSLEFEQLAAYRLSLISMVRLLSQSPAEHLENAPIFLQKRTYPRRFGELIEREATAHEIDPLLFYSLIRQESLFESGAYSHAAAQGLAQIIPDTGEWIAQRVGYPNYANHLVYRPHINVRFGAYYLDWARDYLDGNLVSALVGYNAGPGNSEHWRGISGPDDPFFVEILTYTEPRIYVQTIVEGVYHYVRLYGNQ